MVPNCEPNHISLINQTIPSLNSHTKFLVILLCINNSLFNIKFLIFLRGCHVGVVINRNRGRFFLNIILLLRPIIQKEGKYLFPRRLEKSLVLHLNKYFFYKRLRIYWQYNNFQDLIEPILYHLQAQCCENLYFNDILERMTKIFQVILVLFISAMATQLYSVTRFYILERELHLIPCKYIKFVLILRLYFIFSGKVYFLLFTVVFFQIFI